MFLEFFVKKTELESFVHENISLSKGDIVFLYGDLAAGKTTLSQYIFEKYGFKREEVLSPTYTYYNKYGNNYHFDLYRLQKYDEFISIAWEEILDSLEGFSLIEWPNILESIIPATMKIHLFKTEDPEIRKIQIETCK